MHTSALHLVTEEERECIQLALGFLPKRENEVRFCLRTTLVTLKNAMELLAFGQIGQVFKAQHKRPRRKISVQ